MRLFQDYPYGRCGICSAATEPDRQVCQRCRKGDWARRYVVRAGIEDRCPGLSERWLHVLEFHYRFFGLKAFDRATDRDLLRIDMLGPGALAEIRRCQRSAAPVQTWDTPPLAGREHRRAAPQISTPSTSPNDVTPAWAEHAAMLCGSV
jgi:hypothetical protein